MGLVLSVLLVRLRLEIGVRLRLVVVRIVRPLRWLMGGEREGVGVGIRRMFPTLVRKLRHGPLCEGPQGPPRDLDEEGRGARRLVGQIASGSAVCDATNLVWTGCVDCGLAWCLVVWSPGRLVRRPPSDSVRDRPQPCLSCPIPFLFLSCPVLTSPSRGRGSELKRCSAAVLQVCRCWRPSVSRRAWMTLTILDLSFGLFGDQSRGRAAQEPG